MKSISISSYDYRQLFVLHIKEKLHSFLLGFITTTLFLFFLFQKSVIQSITPQPPPAPTKKIHTETDITVYSVRQGDDLWSIAEKMYGSGFNAFDIAQANKLHEPYTIIENQLLLIPNVTPKQSTKGEITKKAPYTKKISEYIVGEGEYLWQIAEKIYGDGKQMSKIINANNISYPYNVEKGQKLRIPE